MINAAIVGLGWWGASNIVNAVQGKSDRVRFVRGVSIEPEPVRAFAAQHGLDLSTSLADALRDPNVQMVVLATPHSLHPKPDHWRCRSRQGRIQREAACPQPRRRDFCRRGLPARRRAARPRGQ